MVTLERRLGDFTADITEVEDQVTASARRYTKPYTSPQMFCTAVKLVPNANIRHDSIFITEKMDQGQL